MAKSPYPIDPVRTGIAMAYQNEEMIADLVLPVTTPVRRAEFTYNKYPIAQALTVPDTRMGRRSEANTIQLSAERVSAETEDFGLSDLVPNTDTENDEDAVDNYDPLNHATETVTEMIVLDRELRVAGLVFNAATYDADKKVQLSGSDQFSHPDSDPFPILWDMVHRPLIKPTLGVFGDDVWQDLAINKKLVASVYGAASTSGVVLIEDLAKRLQVRKLVVGQARVNSAKPGQDAVLARAWGKHVAFLGQNKLANNQRGMSFGYTVPQGPLRQTRIIDEPKIGRGGSQRVQVECALKELITASSCGSFIQDATA
jgi:hypothetical protein